MKKIVGLFRFLLFLCLILIVIGLVMIRTENGRNKVQQILQTVSGGKISLPLEEIAEKENDIIGKVTGSLEEVEYETDDVSHYRSDQEILSGDIEQFNVDGSILKMDIEMGGILFEVVKSEDGNIAVEAGSVEKFQCFIEDDTLYLKATSVYDRAEPGTVTLYLPEDKVFLESKLLLGAGTMKIPFWTAGTLEIEIGAGSFEGDAITASNLLLSIGAGTEKITNLKVGAAEIKVGMGSGSVTGSSTGDILVECSMGKCELNLDGNEDSYNYELKTVAGSVELNHESYKGMNLDEKIENGADKTIYVNCSAGTVDIIVQ